MLGSLVVLIHGLPPESIEEPAWTEAQRKDYNDKRLAYAFRVRVDAFEHLDKGEYEIALTRFDEAKEWDPATDRLSDHVREARHEIAENLGLDEPDAPSSSQSSPSPAPSEGKP